MLKLKIFIVAFTLSCAISLAQCNNSKQKMMQIDIENDNEIRTFYFSHYFDQSEISLKHQYLISGDSRTFRFTILKDKFLVTLLFIPEDLQDSFDLELTENNSLIIVYDLKDKSQKNVNHFNGNIKGNSLENKWNALINATVYIENLEIKQQISIKKEVEFTPGSSIALKTLEDLKIEPTDLSQHYIYQPGEKYYEVFTTDNEKLVINGKVIPIFYDENFKGWGVRNLFSIYQNINELVFQLITTNAKLKF